jgi:hypothetical protein
MLKTPRHVLRGQRRSVVKFDTWPQREGTALGILGKFIFFGERQMIEPLRPSF